MNPARRVKNVNQRLVALGLYEAGKDWDPSKSDHDNRLHDLLDEVEGLREAVNRLVKSMVTEE